ncbi:MAG: hypothetical protein ABI342_04155 [Nitrososphaera sp.]|jgi:hypothetical protein
MPDIDGPRYKFSQSGIDDIISKVKDLHASVDAGTMSHKEYTKAMKDTTFSSRAATQEFNQLKEVILASTPGLLEFSHAMSIASSVSNTMLAVTNAINLAQLANQGIDRTIADDKVKLAQVTNQAAKDLAAFGPNSAQYQTDMAEKDALTNKLAYDQQQLGYQSLSTGVTLVASAISIAGSISQTIAAVQALKAMMSGTAIENFAVGLSAVGTAALAILGPIAVVIAAIEGINYAFGLLIPQFGEDTKNIADAIQNNWHVDALTARLLAPFVQTYMGIVDFADESYNQLVVMYNAIVDNIINPLIRNWDNTIGQITGKISTIGDATKINMSNNNQNILNSLGLGATSTATSNPKADAVNQFLITGNMGSNQIQPSLTQISQNSTLALSQSQQQNEKLTQGLATVNTTTLLGNVNLASINTSTGQLPDAIAAGTAATKTMQDAITSGIKDNTTSITTALTQGLQNQQQAYNAALQSTAQNIQDLQNQMQQINDQNAQLATQPQTQTAVTGYDNYYTPNNGMYLRPVYSQVPTDAANQITANNQKIADLKNQIAQLQAQGQSVLASGASSGVLDIGNVGLDPVLSSLGLSSASGIGSVIAGALGGYGAIGGAGITADQLAQFAQTGDYGIITKAAINDANPYGVSPGGYGKAPTQQDQINAWINSLAGSMGWSQDYINSHPYLQQLASQALGYSSGGSSGSSNVGSGQFGGLPGQYGNPSTPDSTLGPNYQGPAPGQSNNSGGIFNGATGIFAADGFDGIVSDATHFVAGEAGPEAVHIEPLSKPGNQGGITIIMNNTIQGSLLADQDFESKVEATLKKGLLAAGF